MATFIGTGAADLYTGPWDEANIIQGLGGKDTLTGGAFSDSIDGGNSKDVLDGGFGDDLLIGGADDDTLRGGNGGDIIRDGNGNDRIEAGAGEDFIDSAGAAGEVNSIACSSGDDTVLAGRSDDLINGGVGEDLVDYAAAVAGVNVNLWRGEGGGGAKGDSYFLVEHARGSAFADVMVGDTTANIFEGGAGNDLLKSRGGSDSLLGGAGGDTLIGGLGGDHLDGGPGFDVVSYEDAVGPILIDLREETFVGAAAEGDSLANFEAIRGSHGGSQLYGDDEVTVFFGGFGQDFLFGAGGDDILNGGGQADTVAGGPGDDTLTAGNADEGGGSPVTDVFLWEPFFGDGSSGVDVVTDFANNSDKLRFSFFSTAPVFADWDETNIDWDGDGVDDLQIETDIGVVIILLNMSAAQFDIGDTEGVS